MKWDLFAPTERYLGGITLYEIISNKYIKGNHRVIPKLIIYQRFSNHCSCCSPSFPSRCGAAPWLCHVAASVTRNCTSQESKTHSMASPGSCGLRNQPTNRAWSVGKPWETHLTSKNEDQYIYLETPNALEFLGMYIYICIHNLYD